MQTSTQIKSITVEDLNVPLTEPFGISGGAQAIAQNLVVKLTLQDGTIGLGEAAPLPPYNGETQEIARAAILSAMPLLIGKDSSHWRAVSQELEQQTDSGSARCALETALLDAFSRHNDQPLHKLFGGKGCAIESDMTITTQSGQTREESLAHAKNSTEAILGRGIRIIKTKVGSDIDLDVARIKLIRELAPDAPLILDGNGGFTADEALRVVEKLRAVGITPELFEQPVLGSDIEGLKKVTDESGVKVAADESVKDRKTCKEVIERKAAHVVNIKIMKCGVVEAFDIATMCNEAGMGLMIGGNVETILAMTASAHLSYGTGFFQYHDLDTPAWMLENPFSGGFIQNGGMLTLDHIKRGHGVALR